MPSLSNCTAASYSISKIYQNPPPHAPTLLQQWLQLLYFLRRRFRCCKLVLFCCYSHCHTGQCKRTGGCYNELVVAFFSTGGGVKGKKIYTCLLYDLFINLHLFYLWWHLSHRPPVTLQFMALPSNWWFNSWFGLQIQQRSGVLPWQVLFSSVTAKLRGICISKHSCYHIYM